LNPLIQQKWWGKLQDFSPKTPTIFGAKVAPTGANSQLQL